MTDGTLSNIKNLVNPKVSELQEAEPDNSVIVLRYISKEQAKQEIKELLASSPQPCDRGEIADKLSLELKLVAQACAELIQEGIIEFA